MSVPEGKRGENPPLNAGLRARELAAYTVHICTNPKSFPPQYQQALTDRIIEAAVDVWVSVWTANNIMVGDDPRKWMERKRLQWRAIGDCNTLLALIGLAAPVFHLRGRRKKYWGLMTVETRNLIRRWADADQRRYGGLEGDAKKAT